MDVAVRWELLVWHGEGNYYWWLVGAVTAGSNVSEECQDGVMVERACWSVGRKLKVSLSFLLGKNKPHRNSSTSFIYEQICKSSIAYASLNP